MEHAPEFDFPPYLQAFRNENRIKDNNAGLLKQQNITKQS